MSEPESRRAIIVKTLLALDISTSKELEDITKLASFICEAPIAIVNLVDDEQQYFAYKTGTADSLTRFEDDFICHTILQQDVMMVNDALLDSRFVNNPFVTGPPYIRFYAGCAIKTRSGESIGNLTVMDYRPRELSEHQVEILKILSRQVMRILELEASVIILKEEIDKVKESELKLNSILQSSSASHMLVDKSMNLITFNAAAANFVTELNVKEIKAGEKVLSFLRENTISAFIHYFTTAMGGQRVSAEQIIHYDEKGDIWWEVDFNPVHDQGNKIIGVLIDAINITERMQYRNSMQEQSRVLKKIAQFQSHEVRRPVANIIALADVLQDKEDKDFKLHLQYIKEEAQALDEKIHHIVQLSYHYRIDG